MADQEIAAPILAFGVYIDSKRLLRVNDEVFPYYLSEEGPRIELGNGGLMTLWVPIVIDGPIHIDSPI